MTTPFTQDLSACMADSIGDGGLSASGFQTGLSAAERSLTGLRAAHADGSLPLLALPGQRDDLNAIGELAARFQSDFDDVLVLGMGGSSLGGLTLAALAPVDGGPRVHFMENIDPDTFDDLFAQLDMARTGVIAVSKSGSTAETMTQLAVVTDELRAAMDTGALARHVVAITEPGDRPLGAFADRFDIQRIDHDPQIGGRYSALSVVGLLPAAIAGLDPVAVREGAAAALAPLLSGAAAADCPFACGAAVAVGLAREHGVGANVLMPYSDRLADFSRWYAQLWAESLGKDGHGTTPVAALGAVDQHSQLQLYLDGPADKMITLILPAMAGRGRTVSDDVAGMEGLAYLKGRTMGDLMDAEGRATADALAARGRPVRVLSVPTLDGRALGALMMHFMLETIIAGDLLGVNAFDQPAVEDGKIRARAYLAGEEAP